MGSIASEDAACRRLVRETDAMVASVEYRLAPENPHPAPIEDVFTVYEWLWESSGDLGFDRERLVVGGGSAGGGLAAALGILARDRGTPLLAFQALVYPMLDDRNTTPSSRAVLHPQVWNRKSNLAAWAALLGAEAGGSHVSPYAAPARATDLTGLPPTYIAVGALDLFLDECVEFASRLLRAGVPTELHVYPGAFHGSDFLVPDSPVSRRWNQDRIAVMRRALGTVSDQGGSW